MSTKIYDAWRVPIGQLKNVLARYTEIVHPLVEDMVFKLLTETPSKVGDKFLSPWDRFDLVWEKVKEMGESVYRDLDNPEGSAVIYLHGRYAYIRCLGEYDYCKLFSEAVIDIPGYQEYVFFDGTDSQADKLGWAGWQRRGKNWEAAMKNRHLVYYFFEAERMSFLRYFNWGWYSGTKENPDFHVPERFKSWFEYNAREYWERTVTTDV